jgi:mono/diheme cytochrome c family protein
VYADVCGKCHQIDGYGDEDLYPSLHDPDLLADRARLIRTILDGRLGHHEGEAGDTRLMPALDFLTDEEIQAVIAFISNSWGNEVLVVSVEEIEAARGLSPTR